MLNKDSAQEFAQDWIAAWNSHDLNRILEHYSDEAILTSPVAAQILKDPSGMVEGKKALRNYFQKGLSVYPDLTFELVNTCWGIDSVVLYYINQKKTMTAEFMQLDAVGKVSRVVANYDD